MSDSSLKYWDREQKCYLEEDVFAKDFLHFVYQHPFGKILGKTIFSSRPINYLYGLYKQSPRSAKRIADDIEKYKIDMSEFEAQDYTSYRDFFLRKYLPQQRPFDSNTQNMPAFAEGKYLGFAQTDRQLNFPLKGTNVNIETLLGTSDISPFEGGPMLIARLCPLDYHYFHFPDTGKQIKSYRLHGRYHSVNMLALMERPSIFFENERQINILETENFGKLAFIEVGAMCVGKIIQEHTQANFTRGERKGYFDFGASTVIVLGEPGRWLPSTDILESTLRGAETKVKLGTAVAYSPNKA